METKLKKDAIRTIRMLQYDADKLSKEEVDQVLHKLESSMAYETVTRVHLEDLKNLGFLVDKNTPLQHIANSLHKDYQEQLFSESLHTISESYKVYHSREALKTLCNLCADIQAHYAAESEELKRAEDLLYFSYTEKELIEWDYKGMLTSLDVICRSLDILSKEEQNTYTNLINRVKELIAWIDTSLIS